jgi:hypothetical protein
VLPEGGEFAVLGAGGLVAGEGAAVGVRVVGLVEFPDLVAEGVLEGVAALLAEPVGPDVAVVDEVVAGVAEAVKQVLELCAGGLDVGGAAPAGLGGRADVAQFAGAPVAVVVGGMVAACAAMRART